MLISCHASKTTRSLKEAEADHLLVGVIPKKHVKKYPLHNNYEKPTDGNLVMKPAEKSPKVRREATFEELARALEIDKDALEHECRIQPDCFFTVAKMLALETSRRDEAANTLKDTEAVIDQEIRDTAFKKDDKITEKGVESLKRLNKDVKAARQMHADLEYKVGRLNALTEAWRKRNDMLKLLAQLYVASYFGDVTVRTDDVKTVRANKAKAMLGEQYRRERDP